MKKVSIILVMLCVLCFSLSSRASALEILESGYCGGEGDGTNLSYTLDSDGKLTISGTGRMADWEYSSSSYPHSPWYGSSSISELVIEDGVTTIGDGAFALFYIGNSRLSVSLPSSVVSIGAGSFYNNYSIETVTLRQGLKSIGKDAFYNAGINRLTMPDSVESVGYEAFCDSGIRTLKLSAGLRSLPGQCFYGTKITTLTIPAQLTDISYTAFSNCVNLTTITVEEGNPAYSSYNGCLYDADKTALLKVPMSTGGSFSVPATVRTIGNYAFNGCESMTSVSLPAGLESIGSGAFYRCEGLTGITLPETLTSIGSSAFLNCSGLTEIVIPDSVTSIGDSAFSGCGALSYVRLPSGLRTLPAFAFDSCASLTAITLPDEIDTIRRCAFRKTGLTEITIPDSVINLYDDTFFQCAALEEVRLSQNLTFIGDEAFSGCSALRELFFPINLMQIGSKAFYNCTALASLTFSKRLDMIAYDAFQGCSIDSIVFIGTANDWQTNEWCYYELLKNEWSGAAILYTDEWDIGVATGGSLGSGVWWELTDDGVLTISGSGGTGSLADESGPGSGGMCPPWRSSVDSIRAIVIEDGITDVGNNLFADCWSAESLSIASTVTSLGTQAFKGCSSLQQVTIPDGVLSLGSGVFSDCSSLSAVELPANLEALSTRCFSDCSALTAVELPSALRSIGISCFSGCSSLQRVEIPAGVETVGQSAFYNCSGMTSVQLLEGLRMIDNMAFYGCASLRSVTIPASVTEIGEAVFSGCGALSAIRVSAGNDSYTSVDGVLFTGDLSVLLNYPNGKSGTEYTLPGETEEISTSAFAGNFSLESVTATESLRRLGESCFERCVGLKTVTVPAGIYSVPRSAFAYCSALETLVLPKTLSAINGYAFSDCAGLGAVYYEGTAEDWEKIYIASGNSAITEEILSFGYVYPVPGADFTVCEALVEATAGQTLSITALLTTSRQASASDFAVGPADGTAGNWVEYGEISVQPNGNDALLISFPLTISRAGVYQMDVRYREVSASCTVVVKPVQIPQTLISAEWRDGTMNLSCEVPPGLDGIRFLFSEDPDDFTAAREVRYSVSGTAGETFTVSMDMPIGYMPVIYCKAAGFVEYDSVSYFGEESTAVKIIYENRYVPSRNGWGFGNYLQSSVDQDFFYNQICGGDDLNLSNLYVYWFLSTKTLQMCEGMAISSYLVYKGDPSLDTFQAENVSCAHDIEDRSVTIGALNGMTLDEFILASWYYQYRYTGVLNEKENRSFGTIIEKVKDCVQNGGEPVVIVTRDYYTNQSTNHRFFIGHVVVAYGLRELEDRVRVYVYDCDQTGEELIDNMYIDFLKSDGELTGEWTFDLQDGNVFGTTSRAELSYVDSITTDDLLHRNFELTKIIKALNTAANSSLSVSDSSGKKAICSDGYIENTDAIGVLPIYENHLNMDSAPGQPLFGLTGTGQYTITGLDDSDFSLETASEAMWLSIGAGVGGSAVLDLADDISGVQVNGELPTVNIVSERYAGESVRISEKEAGSIQIRFSDRIDLSTEGLAEIEITREDSTVVAAEFTGQAYLSGEELYVEEDGEYRRVQMKLKGDRVLYLPEGLQVIESQAFADLADVDRIVIPQSVIAIADDAFEGTDALLTVYEGSCAEQWAAMHGYVYVSP